MKTIVIAVLASAISFGAFAQMKSASAPAAASAPMAKSMDKAAPSDMAASKPMAKKHSAKKSMKASAPAA